jgi:hypothetical protein
MLPAVVFAAWLAALAVQFADVGTARFDERRLARGTRSLVRLHSAAWVIPLAAIAVVAVGVVVQWAARLLFEDRAPIAALAAGMLAVAVITATWFAITVAATRPAADSYRAIRDELVDVSGVRVQQERLDELRVRLIVIDDSTDRSAVMDSSLRTAIRWVLQRPQRLVPPALAFVLLIVVIVAVAVDPSAVGAGWRVVGALAAVVVSSALAVAGARASLSLIARVRDTQVEYRAEVVHLLSEAEKISKKRVAGLGDRVARALQILREQQG